MNEKLLSEFLSEEADPYVRRKLLDAIREQRVLGVPTVKEYTFDRFNISLDFETKEVARRRPRCRHTGKM